MNEMLPSVDEECDLLVIGGGLAGMAAAVRAAQLSANVIVLERSEDERYLCNSRITAGFFHICLRDILSDEPTLFQAIDKVTGGAARPDLAMAIAKDTKRAVRWLQSLGVPFIKASAEPYHNFVIAPPPAKLGGLDWKGRGGDLLLRTLESKLNALGGRLHRGARVVSLVSSPAAPCAGAIAQTRTGVMKIKSRGVVLAAGGFESSLELLRQHISPNPQQMLQRNSRSGNGDALDLGLRAGAALSRLDGFYGHLHARAALGDATLWPYPWLDPLAEVSIVVGPDGRRMADEGRGGVHLANRIARLQDPSSAWLITDQEAWRAVGTSRFAPANPSLERVPGAVIKANSIEDLCQKIRIPGDVLAGQIASFNEAIRDGSSALIEPERTQIRSKAFPIVKPPFVAIPLCVGITYTMGGILADQSARALDSQGGIVEGLYVAGGSVGGIEGGDHFGYVGGLAIAATTGMRAAEHFCEHVIQSTG